MNDLEHAEAARHAAWMEYAAIVNDLPECEHVRAWREATEAARTRHLAAIRKHDRAITASEAPASVPAQVPDTVAPPSDPVAVDPVPAAPVHEPLTLFDPGEAA